MEIGYDRMKDVYEEYLKDKKVTHLYYDEIEYHTVDGEYIGETLDDYKYNKIVDCINHIRSNPIDTSDVYIDLINNESLNYEHVYIKPRVGFDDYNPELVNLIKDVYPLFSLQKEYHKLSIRKRYSDKLDSQIRRFLSYNDENLTTIYYYPEYNELDIYLKNKSSYIPNNIASVTDNEYNIKDCSLDINKYIYGSVYIN